MPEPQGNDLVDEVFERQRIKIALDRLEVSPGLAKILGYLQVELFNSNLMIKDLPVRCGSQTNQIYRYFRDELKSTPREYLRRHRLEAAKELLQVSELPIWRIAELVGLGSGSALARAFVREFGASPTALREKKTNEKGAEESGSEIVRIETRAVDLLWPRICGLSTKEQERLLRHGYRVNKLELIDGLIEKSLSSCRGNRRLGLEMARLAADTVTSSREELLEDDFDRLFAEATLNLGNIQRLTGDLLGAENTFNMVDFWIDSGRARSVSLRAKVYFYQGMLSMCRRRFSEARDFLEKSLALSSNMPEGRLRGQVLIAKGYIYELEGKCEIAIDTLEEAALVLASSRVQDPYLVATLHSRLASVYCAVAKLGAARESLARAFSELGTTAKSDALAGARWIEGLLNYQEGNVDGAESILKDCRASFVRSGETVNGALVSLDLAAVFLAIGRTEDAWALATEAALVLQSAELPRETLSAVHLLIKAANDQSRSGRQILRTRWEIGALFGASPLLCRD